MRCLEELDEVSHIYPIHKVWFWNGPLDSWEAPAITQRLKSSTTNV